MTFAPASIKTLETYWKAQRGVSLGIVGDAAHLARGVSYHCGADQLADGAYSATLPRDKAGLTNAASAIDLGKLNGSLAELQAFSRWFVSWCAVGSPGTRDVREVIYTPNGQLPIHRWSSLDNRVYTGPGSGNDSHLTHTHVSFWRDSEHRPKVDLFAPYFAGATPPDTGTGGPTVSYTVTARPFPWYVAKGTTVHGYDPARPGGAVTSATFESDQQGEAGAYVYVTWAPGTDPGAPSGGPFLAVQGGTFDGLLILRDAVSLDPPTAPTVTTGTLTTTTAPDGQSVTVTIS